jgi:hypothetical protein
MVLGSGAFVSLLARHALVDEYRLPVSPVFHGWVRPLVDGLSRVVGLELAGVMSYPSDNVMLRYGLRAQH